MSRHSTLPALGSLWLLVLSLEWMLVLWLIPEGAYLVFPLYFLYVHMMPRWWGPVAVIMATGVSIVALGLHAGWTIGGVVGPVVGAGVAIVIGLGYRSLAREATERERLLTELVATQRRLAATEREAGVLAERARLARDPRHRGAGPLQHPDAAARRRTRGSHPSRDRARPAGPRDRRSQPRRHSPLHP